MLGSKVWNRDGVDEIEKNPYIRMISIFTFMSIAIVALGAYFTFTWEMSWVLLLITFVVMLGGGIMFTLVKNPFLSAIGVVVMSTAAGMMMGPVVASYKLAVVLQAVILTAGVVGVMSIVGILFPKVFEGFGPYLLAALSLLLVAQCAQIIFIMLGFEAAVKLPILAWIGIVIFSLYVAFDWSRALSLPHTVDNAIDAAGSTTLDAINIFIRILSLLGGRSSSRD